MTSTGSLIALVALAAGVGVALAAMIGWKLGRASGLLDGGRQMLEGDREIIAKLASYIAWQERKLDQLGYDPATDPELAETDPAQLGAAIEEYLADQGGGS